MRLRDQSLLRSTFLTTVKFTGKGPRNVILFTRPFLDMTLYIVKSHSYCMCVLGLPRYIVCHYVVT